MSTLAKVGVLAAIAVAAVAAFFVFRGGETPTPTTTVPTRPIATTPAARVVRDSVEVKASGPIGGVKTFKAFAGDRVLVTVKSVDYTGEVHLHGFDIAKEVAPGQEVVFALSPVQTKNPKVQGIVEMELESTSTLILKLEIQPS